MASKNINAEKVQGTFDGLNVSGVTQLTGTGSTLIVSNETDDILNH